MSVERRHSRRYPLTADVYIRYRKQRASPAKAENCSLYGMSLRTENLTLLSGALVELDIFRDGRNWHIAGVVTHARKEGLGVMFCHPQSEFYTTLVPDKGYGLARYPGVTATVSGDLPLTG